MQTDVDVAALKLHLSKFNRSPELVGELNKIINGLDETTPITTRIDLGEHMEVKSTCGY